MNQDKIKSDLLKFKNIKENLISIYESMRNAKQSLISFDNVMINAYSIDKVSFANKRTSEIIISLEAMHDKIFNEVIQSIDAKISSLEGMIQ